MTNLTQVWSSLALLYGIAIGSFLNVVIWRLPRGGSLLEPRFSYCPRCRRQLTALDLVPLFSFLLLRRRCRTCKADISWRYFTVELLTGLLFFGLAIRFRNSPADAVALMAFTALLVPMAYIDLDFLCIPNSLNALAFLAPLALDLWGIAHHQPESALLWNWMPRSIAGALAGVLIFGAVRVGGWIWKRREAMGLGDVLLARSMGAMLALIVPTGAPILRLFPAWVLLSCLSGLAVGVPLLLFKGRNTENSTGDVAAEELEEEEPPLTLRDQLADIGYCIVLGDFREIWLAAMASRRPGSQQETLPSIAEEEFTPDPTAIPFGPYLALGFLASVFVGEALTAWYLAIALPKPGP